MRISVQLLGLVPQGAIPLISALIGAIVGGLATFASTYYIQQINERKKKTRLRRALVIEVLLTDISVIERSAEVIIEHLRKTSRDEPSSDRLARNMRGLESTSDMYLRNDVYTENLSQIGIFDTDQVAALLIYYYHLDKCLSAVQAVSRSMEEDLLSSADAEGLMNELVKLKNRKGRLLEELNTSEFDNEVEDASRRQYLEGERKEN